MKLFLKNPLSLWFRWLVKKLWIEARYHARHVKLGYLSNSIRCSFGHYNTIYDHVFLVDVTMGDYSYVGSHSQISRTAIGKFSAIGENVTCGLGRHPANTFVSIHPAFYSFRKNSEVTFADRDYFEEYRPVVIGNDVWIGSHAIIVDGIQIGDGAIVGAGSVVTKDVSPYSIVGGVPAKIIGYRFSSEEIDFLLKLQWWNKDLQWFKQHYKKFHDIKNFISSFKGEI